MSSLNNIRIEKQQNKKDNLKVVDIGNWEKQKIKIAFEKMLPLYEDFIIIGRRRRPIKGLGTYAYTNMVEADFVLILEKIKKVTIE